MTLDIRVIDDVQIWTGAVLKDFLLAEPEWKHVEPYTPKTAIFQKVAAYVPWKEWNTQPYVHRRSQDGMAPPHTASRLGRAVDMIRNGQSNALMKRALGKLVRGGR